MTRVHSSAEGGASIPTELVARLEAASVGSRELDGLLARHFGWHRVEPRHTRNKAGGWIAPEDFLGVWERDGAPRLDGLHGTTIHRDPPPVTTSLDAALALAERVLPGWMVVNLCEWEHDILRRKGPWHANLKPLGTQDRFDVIGGRCENAANPALALCIAILKATTASASGDDGAAGVNQKAPGEPQ